MAENGAIASIFIFFLGIYLAIPSQANILLILINAFSKASPTKSAFLSMAPILKVAVIIIGVLIILVDIAYIIGQIKKGNWI